MQDVVVVPARSAAQIEAARVLCREYAAALSFSLQFQDFEHELAKLPGDYAPPRGCLLLGEVSGDTAGCVALRDLGRGRAR